MYLQRLLLQLLVEEAALRYIGYATEAAQHTYAHVCSRIYIGYATEAAQLYESIDMNGDVATQAIPYF